MKFEKTGWADEFGFPVLRRIPEPADETVYAPATEAEKAQFEAARMALEMASGGKNTLLYDDLGYPSVMVRIPKFRWCDVIPGGPQETCSAFIVNGKELDCIYISKYLNVVERGRAYSLPNKDPANTIQIDEAREACMKKGKGWHLLSNAEWCALAYWSIANGTKPHGNGRFGSDHLSPWESGVTVPEGRGFGLEDQYRTLTGSGPDTWNHDHGPWGVSDMNGNVWDWVSGFRVMDGEIQIIPNNDSAASVDESPDSPLWKAILPDGTLVEPGTPGTCKYDGTKPGTDSPKDISVPGGYHLNTELKYPNYTGDEEDTMHRAFGWMRFFDLKAAEGVQVPDILRQLAIMPPADESYKDGAILFLRNYGERVCARGGSWFNMPNCGIWDLYLRETRAFIYPDIGFRSAYADI